MRWWVLTAAAALTMAVGAPVVAQQPASEQPQQAERIQKRRALRNRMQARWQRLDKDGNGSISREQWPRRPEAFDRLDTNKDGVLTRDELAARRATRRR